MITRVTGRYSATNRKDEIGFLCKKLNVNTKVFAYHKIVSTSSVLFF